MISPPPFLIFLLGMTLIPFLKGPIKKVYMLLIPTVTFVELLHLEHQTSYVYKFLDFSIILLQVDRLSLVIGYIFLIIGFLAILYSLHVKENGQILAAFSYMGSALGVVFAGDFFTLFVFSEIMAFTSLALIWYNKEKRSIDAGFRYILMHVFAGLCLFAGIVIHYLTTGSIEITRIESSITAPLFFVGVGLNTAFILIHTWLPDSYPKSTITGGVFLSVYTTKTGVYVLARVLPGYDAVAYMGGAMVLYGVIFALLQNDTRKLLSYHIVSQVGYMVAGVGIGTAMAINGGIAHVFNHILYKALLFMCMGAVIFGTGRTHLTELGGIWRKMPVTMIACMIAAFSISGLPGFNGFVSKGMIIAAAGLEHMPMLQLALILGSIGTFLSFLKLTYFVFFKKPKEEVEAKEVPLHMQAAMGITAFLCVLFGLYPKLLFNILPFEFAKYHIEYHTFSIGHIAGTSQLMMMTAIVFFLGLRYFEPHRKITFDVDYFYRRIGTFIIWLFMNPLSSFGKLTEKYFFFKIPGAPLWFSRNPLAAVDILNDKIRGKDVTEKKEKYPEIPMQMQVVGPTIIFTIIFLSVYLLIISLGWLT
jgi:multicomponent Na+:H+ antiporter subunit D